MNGPAIESWKMKMCNKGREQRNRLNGSQISWDLFQLQPYQLDDNWHTTPAFKYACELNCMLLVMWTSFQLFVCLFVFMMSFVYVYS